MNISEAREAWLARRRRFARDDDEDVLSEAFAAGWHAALPAICGTSDGNVSHNKAQLPDPMEYTIWGQTRKGRLIALVMSEQDARALVANLNRAGLVP